MTDGQVRVFQRVCEEPAMLSHWTVLTPRCGPALRRWARDEPL